MISGELAPEDGSINYPGRARLGRVEQEAPGGPGTLIDFVLEADRERASLLVEAETATEPNRIAEIQTRLVDIGAHSAPARAGTILSGLGFDHAASSVRCRNFRAAGACASPSPPCCLRRPTCCCSMSRPITSISKARSG